MKKAIREVHRTGCREYIISGGEPFLREDLVEVAHYIRSISSNANIVILSNGTCILDEDLVNLAPYVNLISISFDGVSEKSIPSIRGQQRFNQLVEVVKRIKQHGIDAHILPTIHSGNYTDIPAYLELAQQLNASLSFSLFTCAPDTPGLSHLIPSDDDLNRISSALFKFKGKNQSTTEDTPISGTLQARMNCGAGRVSLSIGYDGTIYPCHMLHQRSFAMGNAFTDDIVNILESNVCGDVSGFKPSQNEECGSCAYRYLCGGGCRARSILHSTGITGRDSYCMLMKTFYSRIERELEESLAKRDRE